VRIENRVERRTVQKDEPPSKKLQALRFVRLPPPLIRGAMDDPPSHGVSQRRSCSISVILDDWVRGLRSGRRLQRFIFVPESVVVRLVFGDVFALAGLMIAAFVPLPAWRQRAEGEKEGCRVAHDG